MIGVDVCGGGDGWSIYRRYLLVVGVGTDSKEMLRHRSRSRAAHLPLF